MNFYAMLNKLTEIKLELLCRGIRVSEDVLNRFPGYRYKRASLSEGLCFDLLPDGCKFPVPINLAIHEKFVKKSPFTYDEDKKIIYKDGKEFVKASIVDFPSWYKNTLDDGTLFQEVFQVHYHKILATSLTNFCEYKERGDGCRFCAMGHQIKERKIKSVEHIKAVLKQLIKMGSAVTEVNLNSGTLIDDNENVEQYIRVIKAIREITGLPVYAQICPPADLKYIDRLIEAGISAISFNLEIYDEDLRRKIMPAKGCIPRENYFKAMTHAADILGFEQVSSWLIAGLEPVESTIKGIRHIASAKSIPFVTVFRPLLGSEFEDMTSPEPEEISPIFETLGETLCGMKFNPGKTSGGCVKCNCCSAISEVIL
jgi:hypothetical protein